MQLPGNRTSLFARAIEHHYLPGQIDTIVTSSVTFACWAMKHHCLPGSIFRYMQFLGNTGKKNTNMHLNRD